MKLCWFHLMPYRYLPEDFEEKYRSVWVDVPSHLFDPVKANQLYNEYLDELEFADQVGFDGICINEHHNNAYGIMPSPNITAATLTRRTKDAAIVVLGNSLALYNPPLRVAEEFAMLDCISGGRLVAGFPVGTSMDTNYAYGATPGEPAREVLRSARPRNEGVDRTGTLRVQRQAQPGALREYLAPPSPGPASSGLDSRRRQR